MFGRLLLAAILVTGLAAAQGKKGGGGMNGGGMGGEMMPISKPTKFEQLVEKLKLSKDQRDDVVTALKAALEQSAPLRSQMDEGRVQIAGALIQGKSPDEIKKLTDDYTSLAVQLTDIETKAFGKIYQSLKPNQQAKAGQTFELLVAVLDGPGGGRSGGRGRAR